MRKKVKNPSTIPLRRIGFHDPRSQIPVGHEHQNIMLKSPELIRSFIFHPFPVLSFPHRRTLRAFR